MSAFVTISRVRNIVRLEMNIGAKLIVQNAPEHSTDRLLVSMIKRAAVRFADQRMLRFEKHPNELLRERRSAAQKIRYNLSNSINWSPKKLAEVIIYLQNDLLFLLPSVNSRYYKSDSQLCFDLINWADEQL